MNRWLRRAAIVGGLGLLSAVLTFFGVSKVEEHDPFCTSCHLAPEINYHQNSVNARAVGEAAAVSDLASFHYFSEKGFRCVDCHRGNHSAANRARVLLLAAEDILTFIRGEAEETIAKGAIPNPDPTQSEWQGAERYSRSPDLLHAACQGCHAEALTLVGFENHFHNKLPEAQQAYAATGRLTFPRDWPGTAGTATLLVETPTILTCLDCHRAHAPGFAFEYYLDTNEVLLPACVQCHLEADAGPRDLIP